MKLCAHYYNTLDLPQCTMIGEKQQQSDAKREVFSSVIISEIKRLELSSHFFHRRCFFLLCGGAVLPVHPLRHVQDQSGSQDLTARACVCVWVFKVSRYGGLFIHNFVFQWAGIELIEMTTFTSPPHVFLLHVPYRPNWRGNRPLILVNRLAPSSNSAMKYGSPTWASCSESTMHVYLIQQSQHTMSYTTEPLIHPMWEFST